MKKRSERGDNNDGGNATRWLDIGGILVDIRKGLRELMVTAGLAAMMELLEVERTALCGPRSNEGTFYRSPIGDQSRARAIFLICVHPF